VKEENGMTIVGTGTIETNNTWHLLAMIWDNTNK